MSPQLNNFMLLFISENCGFCQKIKAVEGLTTIKVVETSNGPKMLIDGNFFNPPQDLIGLPELIIGADRYIGLEPVGKKLKELNLVFDENVIQPDTNVAA